MRAASRGLGIACALLFGALAGSMPGDARAQWPAGPGYGPGWYGGRVKVKYRGVYGPPMVVVPPAPMTATTVVQETRFVRPLPVMQRTLVQPPPVLQRTVVQPPPVVETRLVQPPAVEVDRVIQPPPVVQSQVFSSTYPY